MAFMKSTSALPSKTIKDKLDLFNPEYDVFVEQILRPKIGDCYFFYADDLKNSNIELK